MKILTHDYKLNTDQIKKKPILELIFPHNSIHLIGSEITNQ